MVVSPKVSVILTSYNHAKYLREAIESVLSQTYKDFELIIWDDASTDDSWNIICSYTDGRIRTFRNDANQFIEYFRKAIFDVAKGEYIAIHHSDDIWKPEKLEKQVDFLAANPQIGAVFTWAHIIDEDGRPLQDQNHVYYRIFEQPNRTRHEWLNYFFYHGNALCHPSILIRRKCYKDCGFYRYGLAQLADFDMWVRLCLKYDIHVLPEKLVRFRVREGEANSSGDRPEVHIRGQFEFLQVYSNYLSIPDRDEFLKIFPDSSTFFEEEEFDIPFALAMTALSSPPHIGKLFGMQLLFDMINDVERAKKIERIYGFRNLDLIEVTAQHDIFSVITLPELQRQLTDRNAQVQERDVQVQERDVQVQALTAQLHEISISKVWRVAVMLRRIRVFLLPPGSLRTRIAKKLVSLLILPFNFRRAHGVVRDLRLVRNSGLFDQDWYLAQNTDVAQSGMDTALHYLQYGGGEGRNPSPNFCSSWYLDTYTDVKRAGINPLIHYLKYGKKEGHIAGPPAIQLKNKTIGDVSKTKNADRKKISFKAKFILEGSLKQIYLFYHRLPLSGSFRQKLRSFAYKFQPIVFDHYNQTINRINNQRFAKHGFTKGNSLSSFLENFLSKEEAKGESGLALCARLLGLDEPSLALSLVPPPWQIENLEESANSHDQPVELTEVTPSQAPFTIILFVNNSPAHFLNRSIRSVQEQIYKNWQLKIYVNEDGLWNANVLAMQFLDPRIQIKRVDLASNMAKEFKISVLDSSSEYVIFLNPYDELRPEALNQAIKEIAISHSDLLYCANDVSADMINMDFPIDQNWPENIFFNNEVAFSQFIIWRKAYLENLFPDHLDSPLEIFTHIRKEITGIRKPRLAKTLSSSCYLFRQVPGRMSITLVDTRGNFDLVMSVVPLRILVDARLINRQTTGTERYTLELLKALSLLRKEFNLDLKAIALSRPNERIDGIDFITSRHFEAIQNCHVYHKAFPASDGATLAEMALAPSVVFSPLDMILYNNPDYFFNEMDFYNYRKTMRSAANLSDWIIGISEHGKMEIETFLHIPGRIVSSVYLGVHQKHFSPEKQEKRDKLMRLKVPSDYFLFVGTDYPHKNLITLLRALDLVRQRIPTAYLVMVGTQYYVRPQPELSDLMRRMSKNMLHLGHVPDEILPALYHNSRALVYPSLYEGFGLPILEAMLCGAPVIASDATSIPEVSGKAAILVDANDEKQLANAMIRIWNDSELRSRLVTAGHKRAAEFTWDKTARETISYYQEAIKNAISAFPKNRTNAKLKIIEKFRTPPPTILIVTHIRFYPPTAGNEQRLFRIVKYLKKLGYQIVMLVNPFLEATKLDRESRSLLHQYVDYYEEIGDIPLDRMNDAPFVSEIGNEPSLARWKVIEENFCSNAVMHRARDLIEQFSPKIILAEYIWTSRVFALATPDILKVIDTIDMFSRKDENVTKFGIRDTLAITPSEELAFINRSDVIIAIQNSEAEAFRNLTPSCRVIAAGVDFDVDQLPENASTYTQSSTLLIVGSGNHINVHCIEEFLDEAWPIIRKKAPSCRLKIVGKVGNELRTRDRNVELIPYVEDLDATYKDAAVVVNPVYAGTGLKIKSVEALGHGKALVCWTEGAAGIPSKLLEPFKIIHSWEELAESVSDLINNPHKRHNLEIEARQFAKSNLPDKMIYREVADCFDTFCKREMNVLCLYLRYGTSEYPVSMSDLQNWHERKMAGAKITTWIIDNKINDEFDGIDLTTGFRLLSGDNQQREFSAFQKVLIQHREEIESYDMIHFVTSAFNTLFTGYLDYFSMDHLGLAAHRPICLGHFDSYDEPVQLAGEISQSWIRTCFFFMSPETVYSISNFVSFQEESQFFGADGKFLNYSSLSENYKKYITGWLNGEIIQGVAWHSKIPDSNAFTGKALAILNEHMLSVQLRKAGINLVDYYWLKEYSHELCSQIDYPIPDCMEQVKFRQARLFRKVPHDPIVVQ